MKDWKLRFILCTSMFYFNACSFINRRYYTDATIFYDKALSQAPYDAVIIPGFPHVKDSMTALVKNRVTWAWYLYSKGIVKNVIFSGGAVYSPYKEAEIMAMYAEQLGISREHIFTEIEAEHSSENLYYSYKIAQRNNFTRVAVATDVVQSSFLYSLNNERLKIPVDFIPIVEDSIKDIPKIKPDINQELALVANFVSIVDRESLLQRLRGTRGDKVERLMKKERRSRKQ